MENITSKSRSQFEKTEAFKLKRRKLRKQISDKYFELRTKEINILKKLILTFKEQQELKKELRKLNPMESLFIK